MKLSENLYIRILIISLCALPVLAVAVPRFLAFGPVIIAVLGWLTHRPVLGIWPKPSYPALGWAFAFIALMGISSLWAVDPDFALERTGKSAPVLLGSAMLFSLLRSLSTQNTAMQDLFYKIFPVSILLMGLLCIGELYGGRPIYYLLHDIPLEEHYSDNLSSMNRAVTIFILCIFPALHTLLQGRFKPRVRKVLLIFLGLILTAILFKTQSQSAQLAFGMGILAYFIFPASRPKAFIVLSIMLGLIFLSAPWLAQFLFNSFSGLIQEGSWLQEGYAANRMEIWDFVARRALEHPLIGHGVEATRAIKDFDTAKIYHPDSEVLHPHNFALQIWIEFGLLGVVLGAGFLNMLLHHMRSLTLPAAKTLLAVLIIALSISATGYGIWQGWWLGTFALLLGYSALISGESSPSKGQSKNS